MLKLTNAPKPVHNAISRGLNAEVLMIEAAKRNLTQLIKKAKPYRLRVFIITVIECKTN